jgi:hypothetical protein
MVPTPPGSATNPSAIGHHEFPLVDAMHDPQFRKTAMRHLFCDQCSRDDSNHLPPFPQGAVGHSTHQPDVSASINEGDFLAS